MYAHQEEMFATRLAFKLPTAMDRRRFRMVSRSAEESLGERSCARGAVTGAVVLAFQNADPKEENTQREASMSLGAGDEEKARMGAEETKERHEKTSERTASEDVYILAEASGREGETDGREAAQALSLWFHGSSACGMIRSHGARWRVLMLQLHANDGDSAWVCRSQTCETLWSWPIVSTGMACG